MTEKVSQILQVGAIGNPSVGDGRMLPFLTLDTSTNPDIDHLIELHSDTTVLGDVTCTWCWRPLNRSSVYLKLDFSRPVSTRTHLEFPVATKGYVVDWILTVRGLYLQSSKYGQYASEGFGKPAIVVEVPSSATFPIWQKLYKRVLTKRFKKQGLKGGQIHTAIADYKAMQREIWFRRKGSPRSGI